MSVVAVRKTKTQIEIAADSIIVYGDTKENRGEAKLFKENSMIIGGVGSCDETSMMKIFCQTNKPASATENDVLNFVVDFADWKRKKTEEYGIDNEYIVINQKKIFTISGFHIMEIYDFIAIGMGMDFALAALYLGKNAKQACEIACKLSVYCHEPVNCHKIKL